MPRKSPAACKSFRKIDILVAVALWATNASQSEAATEALVDLSDPRNIPQFWKNRVFLIKTCRSSIAFAF